MNVFELFASLSLDTSGYDDALDASEQKGQSFASKLGSGLKTAGKVGAAGIALAGAATYAAGKSFVNGVTEVGQYADAIDKQSQKLHMSAESYQEWDFVMQHYGTSIESMGAAMKTLTNQAETNAEAFEALGLSQQEVAGMSQEELFQATIYGLQGISDESERTVLAQQLLGRGSMELGALLNDTEYDVETLKAQAHELGGVLSDDTVKAGASFQDSLQNMQTAMSGVKNNMLGQFLPAFSTTMDGLANVFAGKEDLGLSQIEEGVTNLTNTLTSQLPTFIQIGSRIISSLVTAITNNLPSLVSTGLSAMKTIGSSLISNLPALASAAVQIVTELASFLTDGDSISTLIDTALQVITILSEGLEQALPVLIPAIVQIILTIIEKLTEPNTMMILTNATFSLMGGLISGIIQAIPSIVKTIPTIIANLISTLAQSFPAFAFNVLNLLDELATSIGTAITEGLGANWDAVVEILDGIKTDLKDKLNGALDVVNEVLDSISSAFTDIFDTVKTTVSDAIDAIVGLFDFDWSLPDLKLPHISVSGGEAPWGIGGKGSLPTFDIEWYRKAYDDAYMLNNPTIFGFSGGTLLGGGEGNGGEMVMGEEYFQETMLNAASRIQITPVVNVYVAGQEIDGYTESADQRIALVGGGRG